MPSDRVVFASYNIHSCIGMDGRYDPDRIVTVLQELKAGVVALQEVDSKEHRGLQLLHYLAEATGLQAIAGPTLMRETGHYGNALLTAYDIKSVQRLDLTFLDHEPRAAIDAVLIRDWLEFQVIATHLGLKPAERRFQTQRLLDRVRQPHCALLGDFNEWFLWGRPLQWLKAIFDDATVRATFPANHPVLALDRIWVRPRASILAAGVHDTACSRVASDHLPVTAVVQWSGTRGA